MLLRQSTYQYFQFVYNAQTREQVWEAIRNNGFSVQRTEYGDKKKLKTNLTMMLDLRVFTLEMENDEVRWETFFERFATDRDAPTIKLEQ